MTKRPIKILHVSDVHLFKNKRHEEAKTLTLQLVKLIQDEKVELVYCGGDVVDSKANLSPEQIEAVTYFFYEISKVCPIVMIPGNHDINLKVVGSLDSLSPIISNINSTHPIYYLKESGIYNIYDIDWVVWSCIDKKDPYEFGKRTADFSIGCFHGAVKGCVTDSDWELANTEATLDLFDKVQNCFLADIHLFQKFRNDEIAFSGSWRQTNMGEGESKGVIIWNWNNTKYIPVFHELKNEFGYQTYTIKDLELFDIKTVTPPTSKFIIRLLYVGSEDAFSTIKFLELKKLLKVVISNEIILQKRFKKKYTSTKSIKQKEGEVIDFFGEFYKREGCTQIQIDQLKTIDIHYNKLVDNTEYQIGEYFIEEIELENFLCYGSGNIIDLSSMPGLIGLFARNTSGKTTILNALMFCLFNRAPKSSNSLLNLINDQMPEGTKAFVQVKLLINGSHWRIKRTIIPTSNGGKVKLEVFETVDGIEVPKHEESRPQTDTKVLRKLLGDEEVFFTTILCTADNLSDFVKFRNADRLDLVIKFLGISIYDQKYKLCDEEYKKTGYLYEQLKEELDRLIPLAELEEAKDELNVQFKIKKEASIKLQTDIDTHLEWNKALEQKIQELNIIGISKTFGELIKESKGISEELDIKEKQLVDTIFEKESCLKTWKEKVEIGIWKRQPNKFNTEKDLISDNKATIKHLKSQLESELCPTCKQTWHKVNRSKVEKEIQNIEKENLVLIKKITQHTEEEKELELLQSQYKSALNSIELYESKIELLKNKKEVIQQQIKIVEDNKIKINKKQEREEKIAVNNTKIDLLRTQKQLQDSNILFLSKEIDTTNSNIRIYNQKLEAVEEQESFAKGLMLYKKGMHRTGMPSLILETYIPAINNEINNQINDLYELNVKFELKENNLDISFYYDEFYNEGKGKRDITQASGMEGVVINLAIRAALTKISLLPKPSLWMLDEVFTPLDVVNLEQVKPYLLRLKDQYNNIIIISHQDEVKDLPSYFIQLDKINGITTILP